MRKAVSALVVVFVSVLAASAVEVQNVFAPYVSGGERFPLAGGLTISFPSNSTYNVSSLDLVVTSTYLLGPKYADFCYSLNGEQNVSIPLTGTQEPREGTRTYANGTSVVVNSTFFAPFILKGETTLSNLTEGPHTLVVYAKYTANNVIGYDESTVQFTINKDSKVATIPEFPSLVLLIVGLFVITVLSIVYRLECEKVLKIKAHN